MPNKSNFVIPARSQLDYRANIFFGLLLISVTAYFVWWGIGYSHNQHTVFLICAILVGMFMAFNIGGNDVANSFGTSVGAGTITLSQALIIAAIFELSGAVLAGGEVTNTIRNNIVNLEGLKVTPTHFMIVMLSSLMAAGVWLFYSNIKGLPVSTTHAIIGGILGSSVIMGIQIGGAESALATIHWAEIRNIVISWVLSPVLGGVLTYFIYGQIQSNILLYNKRTDSQLSDFKIAKKMLKKRNKAFIEQLSESLQLTYTAAMLRDHNIFKDADTLKDDLETDYYKELYDIERAKHNLDGLKAIRQWIPLLASLGGVVITAMIVFKGLKNINLNISTLHSFLIMAMVGSIIWLILFIYTKNFEERLNQNIKRSTLVIFSWLQVFTAAGFAFSHGANDIANALGPFIAIFDVISTQTLMLGQPQATVPSPVMITFAIALITGLWFISKEVIQTVGTSLAKLHPASGFSAELSASTVILGASMFGLPVSSTHVLVGSVIGIGVVNKDTNWIMMRKIGLAWIVTLPIAACLSMFCYYAITVLLKL